MYGIKNVLTHEPVAVKAALVAVLGALVITGVINLDGEAVAAWGIAVELVLGLFYVRQTSASKAALDEWKDAEEEALQLGVAYGNQGVRPESAKPRPRSRPVRVKKRR